MRSSRRRLGRAGLLTAMLVLLSTQVVLGANPPKGSHGQETDASTVVSSVTYSLAVKGICAHAMLFEQRHPIGTRLGALAVAGDIRASTHGRLEIVAALPIVPVQRARVGRWLALEQRLADSYARTYVHVYGLIAEPRTPQQTARGARRLAVLMRAPDRLRQAAARREQQLRVPDCTGG